MILSKFDNIDKLNLSTRATNALNREGIYTISSFIEFPKIELSSKKSIGKKTLEELHICLDNLKFGLIKLVEQPFFSDENTKGFVHIDGNKYQDVPISDLGLSVRSFNCLINSGYNWISEVITLGEIELRGIPSLGSKSANEILEILSTYGFVLYKLNSEAIGCTNSDLICNLVFNSLKEKMVLNGTEHYNKMNTVYNLFLENTEIMNISNDILTNIDLHRYIQSSEYIENEFKNYLLDLVISRCTYGCSVAEIFDHTPYLLQNKDFINKIIEKLLGDKKIQEIEENIYVVNYASFVDGVKEFLTEKQADIFIKRAKNYTLEEIGIEIDITRERVRQIEEKAIVKLNNLSCLFKEDMFYDIFSRYDVKAEDFNIAFKNVQAFYYLNIRYGGTRANKTNKKEPLTELLKDPIIPNKIKKAVEKAIYKNHVKIASEYVLRTRPELTNYILRTYATDDIDFDEFRDIYLAMLEDIGESDNEKLSTIDRGYENRLNSSNTVLWKYKKKLRYYNMNSYNYDMLFETLNLGQYHNVEYSAKKFLNLYPDVMDEYDIRDEYELHNLLKKQCHADGNISFGRMPNIEFGVINRKEQVLNLLLVLAPVSNTDLAVAYENEYGVSALTVLANYLKDFDIYFHEGIYQIDAPIFPEIMANHMKDKLKDDFYLIEEIKVIYMREFPNAEIRLINPLSIKGLGFRVYSSYVISNRYNSATEYMHYLLTNEDVVDINTIPQVVKQQIQFTAQLYKLRSNYDIVEFSPNKYIKYERLLANGISKSDIVMFNHNIIKFIGQGKYFTMQSLRKHGFSHLLDEYGFEDWFYSSILAECKDEVSYLRIGGNRLFILGRVRVVLKDFVESIIFEQESLSIDIYDLKELLYSEYKINTSPSKIIETTKNTSMHFDAISEKIFADYDTYYEEI